MATANQGNKKQLDENVGEHNGNQMLDDTIIMTQDEFIEKTTI